MHPEEQYFSKFIDLYEHIEDKCYIERTEQFERWYENPIDLPGRFYLPPATRAVGCLDRTHGRSGGCCRREPSQSDRHQMVEREDLVHPRSGGSISASTNTVPGHRPILHALQP
jgi:hypothetical protein